MTLSSAKTMIRKMINHGINKNLAFGIVRETMNEEARQKDDALERFSYEINAEEQRRTSGRQS